jgi:hypothetical protein
MKAFFIITVALIMVYTQSCNIINPKEQTPTYVHVDSFNFMQTSYQRGSSSHDITSFWVYYNNQPVGVYGLPATVPVLTNGNKQGTLTFAPGITLDGINGYQQQYPFYSDDTITLVTNPGKVTYYAPKTGYDAASHFQFVEDFENTNGFIYVDGNDSITVTHDPVYKIEGNGSGYIHLQSPDTTSENIYTKSFSYPSGPAYIEIDYKNSMTFLVGVEVFDRDNNLVTAEPDYILGLNNTSTPKKLYFSLIDFSTKYETLFPGGSFRLAIKAILPSGQSSGYVVLDNIKLITSN